ncbi:MAG: ribonuclease HII [candidate division WWE3 bacterium]|nr:ribonuclease HII [candidate division WWE3 bacterium]
MVSPTFDYEKSLWSQGYDLVCGIDEAGRGPLAGPMLAAAVIFPKNFAYSTYSTYQTYPSIRDSKTLSKKQLATAAAWIYDVALGVGVGRVENTEIDEVGLSKAEQLSFNRALAALPRSCQEETAKIFYLIDAFTINDVKKDVQKGIIRGDQQVFSIAAASIIAKTERDKIMGEYHLKFPQYGFNKHVGYGTKLHLSALAKYGPCPIHRRSFAPMKNHHLSFRA